MPCSANAQQGRKNGLERCRYDSGFWGKHVKLILRGFSHPDYTVGFGISPNRHKYFALVDFTTGGEFHSALKQITFILYACFCVLSRGYLKLASPSDVEGIFKYSSKAFLTLSGAVSSTTIFPSSKHKYGFTILKSSYLLPTITVLIQITLPKVFSLCIPCRSHNIWH